jgi:hypothetical protein
MRPEPLLPVVPSPTGEPVLPQWAVRALAILVTAAGAAAPLIPEGHYRNAALFIIALGAGFGIVSQGVRR